MLGRELDSCSGELYRTRENLQSEFFGKKAASGFRNVFVVGMEAAGGVPCYVVHRLDQHYAACNAVSLPSLSKMSVHEIEGFNSRELRKQTGERVLGLVERGAEKLREALSGILPRSERHYLFSAAAAEHALALSIATRGSREAAKEIRKLQTNHPNSLGDARLIQEALFLRVGVLSNDRRDVWNMCGLAGIPVVDPASLPR